jgi:beta-1,4-N-acetylglucosaminyltransferase
VCSWVQVSLPARLGHEADEGAGGHTAEMKTLLSSLDFQRYSPRNYVHCHGDEMSLRVINEIEAAHNPSSTPVSLALLP